jgi:hypothetical protein
MVISPLAAHRVYLLYQLFCRQNPRKAATHASRSYKRSRNTGKARAWHASALKREGRNVV